MELRFEQLWKEGVFILTPVLFINLKDQSFTIAWIAWGVEISWRN